MNRYADVGLIKDALRSDSDELADGFTWKEIWESEEKCIDSVPTADVVEVVRCKECKFLSHFTDGHLECRLLHDHRPVPCTYVTMQENDFCSYGERREVTE